jgi:alpha-beta hydrolase superfamily lysophospholipase
MPDEPAFGSRIQHQLSSAIDGHSINILKFAPSLPAKAIVIIAHGMAEHPERYTHFAEYLTQQGFLVIAHAHRGHGHQPGGLGYGHFSDNNGWAKVLADLDQVYRWIKEQQSLPIFLLGHSMGSFIAQTFCIQFAPKLAGLILSGSNYQPAIIYRLGKWIAKIERLRVGKRHSSALLNYLAFGQFNKHFKPTKTEYDWLSRDSFQVASYCQDSLCGFQCSTQFWVDFMRGLQKISARKALNDLAKHIPILIFGGDQDPVGRYGAGLIALEKALTATGHQGVSLLLYPGGRHEMLNETNQAEVYQDISQWLQNQLTACREAPEPTQQRSAQQA